MISMSTLDVIVITIDMNIFLIATVNCLYVGEPFVIVSVLC